LHDVFETIWEAILGSGVKGVENVKNIDMYGSAINGLAVRGNSDLDISVGFEDSLNDKKILEALRRCLEN
jgi:predicted nucleotidyltransferase